MDSMGTYVVSKSNGNYHIQVYDNQKNIKVDRFLDSYKIFGYIQCLKDLGFCERQRIDDFIIEKITSMRMVDTHTGEIIMELKRGEIENE